MKGATLNRVIKPVHRPHQNAEKQDDYEDRRNIEIDGHPKRGDLHAPINEQPGHHRGEANRGTDGKIDATSQNDESHPDRHDCVDGRLPDEDDEIFPGEEGRRENREDPHQDK